MPDNIKCAIAIGERVLLPRPTNIDPVVGSKEALSVQKYMFPEPILASEVGVDVTVNHSVIVIPPVSEKPVFKIVARTGNAHKTEPRIVGFAWSTFGRAVYPQGDYNFRYPGN